MKVGQRFEMPSGEKLICVRSKPKVLVPEPTNGKLYTVRLDGVVHGFNGRKLRRFLDTRDEWSQPIVELPPGVEFFPGVTEADLRLLA